MFRLVILPVFSLLFLMGCSGGKEKGYFEEKVYDFGTIEENGGVVYHTFDFTNNTEGPFFITRVNSECGCITSDYTKTYVAPGESGTVTVGYDPWYRPGDFEKEIYIHHNVGIDTLRIRGFVKEFLHPVEEDHPYEYGAGLWMSLKVLAYGPMKEGEQKAILMRYANDSEQPMTLSFEIEGGDGNLIFDRPEPLAPLERRQMDLTYTMGGKFEGRRQYRIYPVVNGTKLDEALGLWVEYAE
ncbi:MAG: DUF1573 domain-containing protein [Rikenellaceae bacterium]|nr:DUF1573 domain-containing protein [Rikenellaceae bacterium]